MRIINRINWKRLVAVFCWRARPCIILVLLLCNNAFAQTPTRNFRSISLEQGLSQSTVYSIVQDKLGFMWMATQDGLNRYDGKSFAAYHPVNGDSGSILSNYIKATFLDHTGELWIGGDQGISRYNYATNTFKNFRAARRPGEWYASSIAEDDSQVMWMGTSAGEIFRLNTATGKLQSFEFGGITARIKSINWLSYYQGLLYLGTNVGLFTLNTANWQLNKIDLHTIDPIINAIFANGDELWIASEGSGLFQLKVRTGAVKRFVHIAGDAESLSDNDVRAVHTDARGNIWVGTFRGLSLLNITSGKFENYYHQSSIPYTINQNSVRSVYQDRQQGMWLGTFYGGISYYHADDIKFSLLNQNTGKLSLNDEVINVIKQDEKGNFWIGTNDKGLNYWNRTSNTINYYTSRENGDNGLSSDNIKAIAFDSRQNVLIGTHNGGLNILNPSTGLIKVLRHKEGDASSLCGDMVYALLKDSKGRIWIGTRSGLDLFDEASQTFRHILGDASGKHLSAEEIAYLFEDSKGRIWIGTTNGVSIFDATASRLEVLPGATLSNGVVNCIAEDQQHRVWVGTRNGLNLYNEEKHSFETSETRGDFLKGTIYGILPDDDGKIWMSTNKGLIRYHPESLMMQAFDSKDGLQNNQFNLYAFCRALDGMLLFGGLNGISYFYPSNIRQQPFQLKVTFTGLELFNKQIAVGDSTGILTKHIDKTEELELSPDQNQFTVFFNTFNYISPNRTQYLYRLKGLDTVWQQTDNIPKASFRNLLPGSYVLEVKAIGPNGENSPLRSIRIQVLTPWYNSTWFRLLVFILLGVGAYMGYRMIRERIRTRQQLRIERMQREKGEYINQVKMDFFTNVSHELRTPLTLILAPLEEMMKRPVTDKLLDKQYQTMYANAKRLYQLVDQLFEFRKTEMGTRKLKVSRSEMRDFVQEIFISFQPLSDRNKIQYTYHCAEEKIELLFDRDAMERILFNLLSNAFKYTPVGGRIKIDLAKNNGQVIIAVSDTGKGIEETHLDKIFDRFYQISSEEMNLGSGVGLAFTNRLVTLHHGKIDVKSTFGKGSVFTVAFPLADECYISDIQVAAPAKTNLAADKEYTLADESSDEGGLSESEMVDNSGPEKLLIVDDNHDIVNYLSDYFSRTYEVFVAFDGVQALKMLEDKVVDLIISDVMMPEMDGLHFCKRIKKNIQTSHIPVILLTAKSETTHQIKGLEMGADDYTTKPFSISLLEAKVENILKSRKRLKQYYLASKEIVPENIAFNSMDEAFLKQAISIVEENLLEPGFSVEKFSRELAMSRSNLYLKLKAITGESVTDFIKRIRFKKAVELLEQRQYTIAEIAYMSGFNSPSYFSTAFKQFYDCMPTEYLAKKDPDVL